MKKAYNLVDQGHSLITHAESLTYKVKRDGLPEWVLLVLMTPFVLMMMLTFIGIIATLYTVRYLHVVLATVVIGYVLASLLWLGTTP